MVKDTGEFTPHKAQFNQDKNRIRLAEAMGWSNYLAHSKAEIWEHEKYSTRLACPDPFTDANDDYAVLEWMRTNPASDSRLTWREAIKYITAENYRIGDYARAALEVIERV